MKNSKKGFIILLLPMITLIVTGLSGVVLIGTGIKNTTLLQSLCFRYVIKTQDKLKDKLISLLKLNKKIISLHEKQKSIQISLATSAALGLVAAIPILKALLNTIKISQRVLSFKQKFILAEAQMTKLTMLKKFRSEIKSLKLKVKDIRYKKLFKKALAVSKKSISPTSHIYIPDSQFSKKQALSLNWKANPFFYLSSKIVKILNLKLNTFNHYKCTATLKKRDNIWQTQLSY